MLYNLFYPLASKVHFFNLFKYITFRTAGATLTSLIIGFLIGPHVIAYLRKIQGQGQPIRALGPESHQSKKGTPTMGGSIILISLTCSTLLWADLSNPFLWIVLLVCLSLGVLGGYDDYIKVSKQNAEGMLSKIKFVGQLFVGTMAAYAISYYLPSALSTHLALPFFKDILLNFHLFFFPFVVVVIVGSSNAVNLTDGLDGLAIGVTIITTLCFGIIAYLVGNAVFASHLQLHFVPGSGELTVFCGALVGASLGFLWYNAPPARVFMGDMGSLAIGGALGTIGVITKHELVLALIGGLFVVETLSVMIQVAYFKYTGGKRIFLMAPLHHHFEKKGWSESTVVIRFWIISFILALLGLATLKLR
ncbi:MAG: phospho-N-acetylmuramoyl-pentapeptide-transferase [Alphaproteobacteria bacterium RIFCSPHIGHO2_01_FULL_41_14]|nr:MAG: phospho-N-acetylmuramoyl-pentapeptide-transferase [Alphaproteobacteria bacterium GWB1_45_5]OFW76611.1 MAG: phospho-N-acetylmuramoyl-pentapeptide-transferase [Alphaproteobacteria bacterium GWA1_45_9]OFW89695.1 MAG: phospho-N-acetylmuramoyl-pentapeptide-transferase [Alphaproteobacteria bacterium RIFCSPHIGHO2_01_FULL_41_14]HCI49138.1 phospho-N-acetylmuramoyl-pentapeptide-transferase [Holosporales bacterium]